jgi:hypothetical protein
MTIQIGARQKYFTYCGIERTRLGSEAIDVTVLTGYIYIYTYVERSGQFYAAFLGKEVVK